MSNLHTRPLANYATTETDGDSRAHRDAGDRLRSPFEIDCHRITTCTAFRRLEGKTQVFAAGKHDHFRNRMTHTIEVAAIGRWLARRFQVNETLVEAIAMAHDFGHPPFGHAGEVALNELMHETGGFNHNTHSVRVVEYLEHPFPTHRGLNLTAATLAGLATHETRYDRPSEVEPSERSSDCDAAPDGPSVESQIASLADRIAYNCHDLEDGIGADLLTPSNLSRVELWSSSAAELNEHAGERNIHAIRRAVLDRLVDTLLSDIVSASQPRLARLSSIKEVMRARTGLVLLSQEMEPLLNRLERFLSDHLYNHPQIARSDKLGQEQIGELFNAFVADVTKLPERFAKRVQVQGAHRVVCDYIAGMTDRFFTRDYDRVVAHSR